MLATLLYLRTTYILDLMLTSKMLFYKKTILLPPGISYREETLETHLTKKNL